MNILLKVFRKLKRVYYRVFFNSDQVKKLLDHKEKRIQIIGKVLQDTLNGSYSDSEVDVSEQVENLRKKLIKQDRKIEFSDNKEKQLESVSYLASVASKKKKWGRFLMKLVSSNGIRNALEFGTCIGISTIYQAKGIKDGKLSSLEGLHHRKLLAEENLNTLNVNNVVIYEGRFDNTLPKVLEEKGSFDYVFLDGDHSYQATVENFRKILAHLERNSIVVIDDIKWSKGMNRAWTEIKSMSEVYCVIDLFVVGIVVIGDVEERVESKVALW